MNQEVQQISQAKRDLAKEAMMSIVESLPDWESIRDRVCFIIAGDVTYDMAHAVPRPEISTGKMVRGSDLDIIVIAEDDVSKEALKVLDEAIFRKKHYLLVHPNYQEEIDYLVKDIAKVRQQLAFDSFQHMIASKIIHEAELLYGSAAVFRKIKAMVEELRVPEKLARPGTARRRRPDEGGDQSPSGRCRTGGCALSSISSTHAKKATKSTSQRRMWTESFRIAVSSGTPSGT